MLRTLRHRALLPLFALFAALAAPVMSLESVRADTYSPANGDQLRFVINQANMNGAAANTIVLAAGTTYTLTVVDNGTSSDANGLPIITSNLTINGNGATITRSAAGGTPNFRLFTVAPGATLSLNNVTLSNGNLIGVNGANGTTGSLAGQPGGAVVGGAINNAGTLILTNTTFSANHLTAGTGGNGATSCTPNQATCGGGAGGTASGGAINNTGTLTVSGSLFAGNAVVGGVNGNAGSGTGRAGAGGNGAGAALSNAGTLTVATSTFSANHAMGGTSGSGVNGTTSFGSPGTGGGIDNTGALSITTSAFLSNTATGGSQIPSIQSFGGIGKGGALNDTGAMTVTNSTFSANTAVGGVGGGAGLGGAVAVAIGGSPNTANIVNATFSVNDAISGSAGVHGAVGRGQGGGIWQLGVGALTIADTILSANLADDPAQVNCYGVDNRFDGGYNLEWTPTTTCGFTNHAQLADPKLDSLKDNNGPTKTFALLSGSAAIGNGNAAVCTAAPVGGLDQRGLPRSTARCDIGAYEVQVGSFALTAPANSPQGASFSLTVAAKDANGDPKTNYTGAVHFASTDTQAILPGDAQFAAADNGVRTFAGIILRSAGSRAITASDTVITAASGSASVTVTGPTLASVSPNSGSTSGGGAVTLTGAGFLADAVVMFGGAQAAVTNLTNTSITVRAPAQAAGGTVVVSVTTGGQTATGAYTYGTVQTLPPPQPINDTGAGTPVPLPTPRPSGSPPIDAPAPLPLPRA